MFFSFLVFLDVHAMIFVGFGFLMTFLKRYGYSAISLNLLLSAIAIQWCLIVKGLIINGPPKVKIGINE